MPSGSRDSSPEPDPDPEPAPSVSAITNLLLNLNLNARAVFFGPVCTSFTPTTPCGAAAPAAAAAASPAAGERASGSASSSSGACCSEAPAEDRLRATSRPSAAASSLPESRLKRAFTAGVQAGRKLRGEQPAVEKTPELPDSDKSDQPFYVIIRALPGCSSQGFCRSWQRCKALVCGAGSRGIQPSCVFHRFETWEEVLQYWQGAGLPGQPQPL